MATIPRFTVPVSIHGAEKIRSSCGRRAPPQFFRPPRRTADIVVHISARGVSTTLYIFSFIILFYSIFILPPYYFFFCIFYFFPILSPCSPIVSRPRVVRVARQTLRANERTIIQRRQEVMVGLRRCRNYIRHGPWNGTVSRYRYVSTPVRYSRSKRSKRAQSYFH